MKKKLKSAKASTALKPKSSNLSTIIIIGLVALIGVIMSVSLLVSAAGGPENPEEFLAAGLTTGTERATITIVGANEDRLNQVSGVKYYALQYPSTMSEFDVFCSKEVADYTGTAIAPAVAPTVTQETVKGATSYYTHYNVGLPIPSQLIRQAVNRGLSAEIEKKTGLCIMIALSGDEKVFKDNVRQISPPRINLITTADKVLTIGGWDANGSGINQNATAWRILDGGYSDSCLAEEGASAFPNKGTTITITEDNDGTWICIRIEDYRGNASVQKMELELTYTSSMWDTVCAYRDSNVGFGPIPEEGFCTEDDARDPINSPTPTVIRNMWDTACAYRDGTSVGIGPLSEEDFCTEDDTRNPINSPAVLPDNSEQDESGNANQSPTIQQTTTVPEEESFVLPPPIPSDAIRSNN